MTLLRLLNIQGIAGIAASLALGILLILQTVQARHWKDQSGHFEKLYDQQQAALAGTVANYRAATDAARAADQANLARVTAEQRSINERTSNDYETRLAAARTLAQRLRGQSASAAADRGSSGATAMPGLSVPSGGPAQATGEDRLPVADGELATEQAIQLDELIKWVRAQAAVDPNGGSAATVDSARH